MGRLIAAMLCAAPALAQDRPPPPPPPQAREEQRKPPLSEQDAQLVKEMALLEKMDLLRNLELFEPEPQAKQTKDERPQ